MHRLSDLELFRNIDPDTVSSLITGVALQNGQPGDVVALRPVDYFILLAGEAAIKHARSAQTMTKLRASADSHPDWLYSLPPDHEIRLAAPSRFVILDGARIDAALGRAQESGLESTLALPNVRDETRRPKTSRPPEPVARTPAPAPSHASAPSQMKQLTDWLRNVDVFSQMSLFELVECASALQPFEAGEGWDVVRAGSEGNYFYLIESGRAEVWRADPLEGDGNTPQLVATLGPGDSFGEEALLQDASRNATVRMIEAGRLLRLERAKFDELIRDALLKQVTPQEAISELNGGETILIDCRYREEYELLRIPGARLLPLDQLRDHLDGLDRSRRYLVYCRSGRRSRAAAFLMQRAGFDTRSIRGGLTRWSGAIERA